MSEQVTVPKRLILSLAEAIYVRYEILAHLAHKRTKMPITIHMAGSSIAMHFKPNQETTRVIQRCAICGAKLLEKHVGKERRNATFFHDGQLVILPEDGGRPYSILHMDSGILPKESCAYLVEPEDAPMSKEDKKAFAELDEDKGSIFDDDKDDTDEEE